MQAPVEGPRYTSSFLLTLNSKINWSISKYWVTDLCARLLIPLTTEWMTPKGWQLKTLIYMLISCPACFRLSSTKPKKPQALQNTFHLWRHTLYSENSKPKGFTASFTSAFPFAHLMLAQMTTAWVCLWSFHRECISHTNELSSLSAPIMTDCRHLLIFELNRHS